MVKKEIPEEMIEALGEKLLEEFKLLGEDYPNLTSMLMDIVGIVSQQNSQINTISHALQDIVLEINKMREVLKEYEWKDRVSEKVGRSDSTVDFGSKEHLMFLKSYSHLKKEDLN